VALATGGGLITSSDVPGVLERLRAMPAAGTPMATRDLWHNAWSFVLVLALLAAEWIARRQWGLR
jgi:hypothetical protein